MIRSPHTSRVSTALRASFAVVVVALGLVATPAFAQDDPYNPDPYDPTPSVHLADSSVCEGTTVVVTVSGLNESDSVTVSFRGQSVPLVAGSGGTASTSFGTTGLAPGAHSVTATTPTASASASLTVLDGDDCDPTTPPTLSVADPAVCVGSSAVATVSNGTPGSTVTVTFVGASAVLTLGADGTASTSFPTAGLAPGEYEFVVTGSGLTASAPMHVLGPNRPECAPRTPNPALGLSAGDTCVGEPVIVTVTGASAGDTVEVTLAGRTATTTGNGSVSIDSADIPAGTHAVQATSSAGAGASTQVTLADGDECDDEEESSGSDTPPASEDSDGGLLAFTGGDPLPLVLAGGVMIAGGALLVWRTRRKSPAA